MYFKSRINLGEMICLDSFIKTVRGSSGDLIVSVPVFNPDSDIVDNARAFIQLDEYSMVLCVENIFTNRATYEIAKKYKIDYRWIRNKKI